MESGETTEAQMTLLHQVRDEWLEIGLDTAPIDRDKIPAILGRLYALANRPAPANIVYLDSPQQILITIENLRKGGEPVCSQVSDQISKKVMKQLGGGRNNFLNLFRQHFGQLSRLSAHDRKEIEAELDQASGVMLDQVEAPVREQVASLIWEQIVEPNKNKFSSVRAGHLSEAFGQFAVRLMLFDYFGRSRKIDVSFMTADMELAKACGWTVLFWDWGFISAKPECIHRDEQGRLHCTTGPAVRYPDGFSVFAIHGVRVPEKVVVSPELITVTEIETTMNAEVRRVMIERYGFERYMVDSEAREIHRDDFGVLYRRVFRDDEPLMMVKVVNATPEPDGSFKDYFLRVPPEMQRARQAVAWTFGKTENDYAPALQT